MDHVGVVVDDLAAARDFFLDIGLEVEGETHVSGGWVDEVVGLRGVHSELVMMRTPDRSAKLELTKFRSPSDDEGIQPSKANRFGIRHIAFAVDELDDVLERLHLRGFGTIGSVQNYENIYRLCYVSGPEGIIIELAEEQSAGR
ncbi:MAG: putative lyase [Frondihabitans sp.]|nr:putative lyase [Frondihabitans sp.]